MPGGPDAPNVAARQTPALPGRPGMNATIPAPAPTLQATSAKERVIQEQVVLVLQGGGALGAYQALMEGGIEPDWVIGTSIGAINGAIIAGNEPDKRVERLREFWQGVGKG